jgi:hypothetical protein
MLKMEKVIRNVKNAGANKITVPTPIFILPVSGS